jgi:hypothetical protein
VRRVTNEHNENEILVSIRIILNPAAGIATESQRAQSQWKRGRLFECFILTPRVTIFQDLLKVSLLICRLCGLGASVANYRF